MTHTFSGANGSDSGNSGCQVQAASSGNTAAAPEIPPADVI